MLPEPRRHIPLCPPAPRDEYERAKLLLSEGMGMAEVRRVTGATWVALDEAAHAYDDYDAWMRAKDMHKAAMAARIAGAAAAAGINGVKRKVVRKTDAAGKVEETVTEEQGTDAALLRVAGEYTDPERFGKLAKAGEGGKGASVSVQVVGTVILAMPPALGED